MPHLNLVYDVKADCQSRVCPDFDRVVNVDENGDEHVVYQQVDYQKIQSSLGSFLQWSLKSLMSAGIDPNFGIKTGFNTRLDGFGSVESAIQRVTAIVEEENNKESE